MVCIVLVHTRYFSFKMQLKRKISMRNSVEVEMLNLNETEK